MSFDFFHSSLELLSEFDFHYLLFILDNLARVARPINILFIGLFTNKLFVIHHN
jgi:hypothetical protein